MLHRNAIYEHLLLQYAFYPIGKQSSQHLGTSTTSPSTELEMDTPLLACSQCHQLLRRAYKIQGNVPDFCGSGLAGVFGLVEQAHDGPGEG
jgi:hypothetical protein